MRSERENFIGAYCGAAPHYSPALADAQLDENALERAETGEGGLEQVEPNKGRERRNQSWFTKYPSARPVSTSVPATR